MCYKLDGDSGAAAWHVGATVGRDVTRGTISGLTAGTRYVFDVQAYNSTGGSPFSNQITVTMPAATPPTPNLQSATAKSSTSAELVWGNISGEDGYKLFYKLDGTSNWIQGATAARDATRGTISGLAAGTRYVFDVQAYNSAGGSPFSNQITVTMPAATLPLTSPEPLALTVKSSTRIDLSWTNSQNEDGYKVWQWKNTGNAWDWVQIATVNRDVTSYSVNNLSPNSTYYFKVQAFNGKGIAETNWKSALTAQAQSGYCKPIDTFPATGNYAGFGVRDGSTYHNGADYASTVGANVYAVSDGVVVYSGQYNGFGSLNPSTKGGVIVVKHVDKFGNPFFAVYGHLTLSVGASVKKGEVIGKIASFYNKGVFLPHLHFGIYTGATFPTQG